MKALTEERWQEIRDLAFNHDLKPVALRVALKDVLGQHYALEKQIKLLADYIMSERPDDPAWKLGEGACGMATHIMRREASVIRELNETMKWLGEGTDDA